MTGSTGTPEAERPKGRKQPAQVKSGGKLEPTRRPRRETRAAWSRLHCLKPNPERMIKGPAATLVRRRRVSGADHSVDRWPARPPGAAIGDVNPVQGMSGRPKPCSIRCMMMQTRDRLTGSSPSGAASWRRRPRSSPRPGKPATWRRGSGRWMAQVGRYATCETPKRRWPSSKNEADEVFNLEDVYRRLFNPDLYLRAYGRIYTKRRCAHQGGHGGDRGRHVPGEDRGAHRRHSP